MNWKILNEEYEKDKKLGKEIMLVGNLFGIVKSNKNNEITKNDILEYLLNLHDEEICAKHCYNEGTKEYEQAKKNMKIVEYLIKKVGEGK